MPLKIGRSKKHEIVESGVMPSIITGLLCAFLVGFAASVSAIAAEISITLDDFNVEESTLYAAKERSSRILSALEAHRIHAGLFVTGKYVSNQGGRDLLRGWNESGHLIGNHTFNHPSYNRTSLQNFVGEIEQCEDLLKSFSGFAKFFRFPSLAEGDTSDKRDGLRSWLRNNDYKVGAVTIDASDWYIDQRMRERLKADANLDLTRYSDYYLQHIWARAQYYDDLAKRVLKREVKHTLLLHFNLLNALFLDDLLKMFELRGWKLIDARDAFKDEIFDRQPNSMPSGQSLIWALAKESRQFESELRYPGEDSTYEKPKMDELGL